MNASSPLHGQIDALLETVDELRPRLLALDPENADLRAMLRRIVGGLERLRMMRLVSEEHHARLLRVLSRFLDAEHGAMLRGEMDDAAFEAIERHAGAQATLLAEGRQDLPATHAALERCAAMLDQPLPASLPLADKHARLETALRRHLRDDAGLRREFAALLEALQSSLEAMDRMIAEIGEEAPELREARRLLEADLPDDAEAARALLARAREGLLSAGGKLAQAGERLRRTMRSHIQQMQSLTEKLEEAERDARNDPLTGLPNRRGLADYLKTRVERGFCFILLDVDHFKQINDRYGHDAGDEVLVQLADILRNHIRDTDLAARLGGEEFCVVFPGASLEEGQRLAERLRAAVAHHAFQTEKGALNATVSVGVAAHLPGHPAARAIKAADQALYEAKRSGRNRVRAAGEPEGPPADRATVERGG
ncbi:MAG: GGDEF domain-containing protein [Mariprofundaceae bacterium]